MEWGVKSDKNCALDVSWATTNIYLAFTVSYMNNKQSLIEDNCFLTWSHGFYIILIISRPIDCCNVGGLVVNKVLL